MIKPSLDVAAADRLGARWQRHARTSSPGSPGSAGFKVSTAAVFGWALSGQLTHGDRGRKLGAYLLFAGMALAVTDALR